MLGKDVNWIWFFSYVCFGEDVVGNVYCKVVGKVELVFELWVFFKGFEVCCEVWVYFGGFFFFEFFNVFVLKCF